MNILAKDAQEDQESVIESSQELIEAVRGDTYAEQEAARLGALLNDGYWGANSDPKKYKEAILTCCDDLQFYISRLTD